MYSIFIQGTAGSGKSKLTSILKAWYIDKRSTAIAVNLDPGVINLPYEPDVDIRDFIDLNSVMESYQLGPNGAMILSSDMIASRLNDIQEQVDTLNPDYVLFDTPGQMELFAYRQSGPYFLENFNTDARCTIFLFDSALASTPTNFVSIALLAASLQIRLKVPQISILSKKDLVNNNWERIIEWSENSELLEDSISRNNDNSDYSLILNILRDLTDSGFTYELIPFSAITHEGIIELSATLARIFKGGEDIED